jgi:hypothetical protein
MTIQREHTMTIIILSHLFAASLGACVGVLMLACAAINRGEPE